MSLSLPSSIICPSLPGLQVSLYQASEKLYTLFDKVAVIHSGHLVYYGPAAEARAYFEEMGYEPKQRQTTSDYLVSVTDPYVPPLLPS